MDTTLSSSRSRNDSPLQRGFLAGMDLERLREKLCHAPFDALFDRMTRTVHEVAARDLAAGRMTNAGWCHSVFVTPAVLDAGLTAAVADDAIAIAHVVRQVDKLVRLYADPPASFARAIEGFKGKPSAYFSNGLTALGVDLARAQLPPPTVAAFLQLARERLIDDRQRPDYFFTHFNAGHNAVTTHVISAAIVALVFGRECGHPDTDEVIERGVDACEQHVRWAYDDDGTPHEGPMYALVTLEWVFFFADLWRRHGGGNLFDRLPRLRAILDANLAMQLPGWRGIIGFDDCRDLITRHPMPWLPLTAREYDRPQDLALWQALRARAGNWQWSRAWFAPLELLWWDGREAPTPIERLALPAAHVGRGKAVAMLRTGWHDDAVGVMLLGQGRSHNIPDHVHGDAGHFSIFCHGELLAYDPAYFNFDEDQHSVVLIDGTPHFTTRQGNPYAGRFMAVDHHPLLDYIAVEAAAAKGCIWAERHFLFVRGSADTAYLVVLDNLNRDNAAHRFTWQLQAAMTTRIRLAGDREAVVEGSTARIDCRFFNPLPTDYPTIPHRLTLAVDQATHRNVRTGDPEMHPRLLAEQNGCNGTLMAILVPRAIKDPPLTIRDATGYRTFNAFIEHGNVIDQIIYACDHTFVRLPGVRADSQIILIRRTRGGQVLDSWTCDGHPCADVGVPQTLGAPPQQK